MALQLKELFGLCFVGTADSRPVLEGDASRKPCPFNVVANNRYWLGRHLQRNRDSVMSRSGIPRLRMHLHTLATRRKARIQEWRK